MKRRAFIQGAAVMTVAAAIPARARPRSPDGSEPRVVLFNGGLVSAPRVDAIETNGDLPALWETRLKRLAAEDLLPMAGVTTYAELELLQQALGARRARATHAEVVHAHGRAFVSWRLDAL